jgi:hypothetical protein
MKGLIYDTAIGDLLKRVELLDIIHAWFDAFDKDIEQYVLYLIQKEQLVDLGINDQGQIIGRYSELTQQINSTKVAGRPYTLLDTGDFFKSMVVKVMRDEFIVDADGNKTNFLGTTNLFDLHGDGIIGLTEYNKERLSNRLKENYIKYVRETLQIP